MPPFFFFFFFFLLCSFSHFGEPLLPLPFQHSGPRASGAREATDGLGLRAAKPGGLAAPKAVICHTSQPCRAAATFPAECQAARSPGQLLGAAQSAVRTPQTKCPAFSRDSTRPAPHCSAPWAAFSSSICFWCPRSLCAGASGRWSASKTAAAEAGRGRSACVCSLDGGRAELQPPLLVSDGGPYWSVTRGPAAERKDAPCVILRHPRAPRVRRVSRERPPHPAGRAQKGGSAGTRGDVETLRHR